MFVWSLDYYWLHQINERIHGLFDSFTEINGWTVLNHFYIFQKWYPKTKRITIPFFSFIRISQCKSLEYTKQGKWTIEKLLDDRRYFKLLFAFTVSFIHLIGDNVSGRNEYQFHIKTCLVNRICFGAIPLAVSRNFLRW